MHDTLPYLTTQTHRMNDKQKKLVERTAKLHEDELVTVERDRLSMLYLWLHMHPGSVATRKFPSIKAKPAAIHAPVVKPKKKEKRRKNDKARVMGAIWHAERPIATYRDMRDGIHRAPSEVRKISVEDYLKEKSAGK